MAAGALDDVSSPQLRLAVIGATAEIPELLSLAYIQPAVIGA
jgi:hypothetical protein